MRPFILKQTGPSASTRHFLMHPSWEALAGQLSPSLGSEHHSFNNCVGVTVTKHVAGKGWFGLHLQKHTGHCKLWIPRWNLLTSFSFHLGTQRQTRVLGIVAWDFNLPKASTFPSQHILHLRSLLWSKMRMEPLDPIFYISCDLIVFTNNFSFDCWVSSGTM